jgi:hypothetical protein
MNTEKSDKIVKDWIRRANPLKRTGFTRQKTLRATPEKIFKLLCPTTEYDWIPDWQCELLHSDSGYAELNAIFKTKFFNIEETWVCTRYEPNRIMEYIRTSGNICAKLNITLTDNYDGTVTSTWTHTFSSLNNKGNSVLSDIENYIQRCALCFDELEYYLENGQTKS